MSWADGTRSKTRLGVSQLPTSSSTEEIMQRGDLITCLSLAHCSSHTHTRSLFLLISEPEAMKSSQENKVKGGIP